MLITYTLLRSHILLPNSCPICHSNKVVVDVLGDRVVDRSIDELRQHSSLRLQVLSIGLVRTELTELTNSYYQNQTNARCKKKNRRKILVSSSTTFVHRQ